MEKCNEYAGVSLSGLLDPWKSPPMKRLLGGSLAAAAITFSINERDVLSSSAVQSSRGSILVKLSSSSASLAAGGGLNLSASGRFSL